MFCIIVSQYNSTVSELTPKQIGHYLIQRELGRGGMGVVYLAKDSRLDRSVAIKVLPEHLAGDAERLTRFEREAKTLAQLHHPNIASIFGIELADGAQYIVLEYVAGETLEQRLSRGPLPIDEALEVCAKIAAGMEAAHDAGVVHRDLKPGNVIISSTGAVKVLDFGLAKVSEQPSSMGHMLSESPTLTDPMMLSPTIPGAILGTAPYMSPEQARGRHVDHRSDIWSFGVLLYECLTGISPFRGETVSDAIGAILHKQPKYDRLPLATPPIVKHVLQRSLERDRNQRWRDIGDVRLELEDALKQAHEGVTSVAQTGLRKPSRIWPVVAVITTLIAISATVVSIRSISTEPVTRKRPARADAIIDFELDIPKEIPLPDLEGDAEVVAISNDGQQIALVSHVDAVSRLYVRDLDSREYREVALGEETWAPCYSPDGEWIAFFDARRLLKVRTLGGPPQVICDSGLPMGTIAWLDDDTIVFTDGQRGLLAIAPGAQQPELVVPTPTTINWRGRDMKIYGFLQVAAIPGSRDVLTAFWAGSTADDQHIGVVSIDDGTLTPIILGAVVPYLIDDDILVFLRQSTLMAVPYDKSSRKIVGDPTPVLAGVWASDWADEATYALSPSGTLVYMPGDRVGAGRQIIRVSPTGEIEPLSEPGQFMGAVRLSPDESRVTVATLDRSVALWAHDLQRKRELQIESEGESYGPVWTPDGKYITYSHGVGRRERLAHRRADGSGSREQLLHVDELKNGLNNESRLWPIGWLADGETLLFKASEAGHVYQIKRGGAAELVLDIGMYIRSSDISPDGKWIAYGSSEVGFNVFARNVDNPDRRFQVSFDGADQPVWSHDGSKLYYRAADNAIYFADVTVDDGLVFSESTRLLSDREYIAPDSWTPAYDVDSAGNIYAVAPAAWEIEPATIRVIVNWGRHVRETLGITTGP